MGGESGDNSNLSFVVYMQWKQLFVVKHQIFIVLIQHSFINNTNLMNIPKHGLGCLVAYSKSYETNILKKIWILEYCFFLSVHNIVIVPITNIDQHFPYNHYKRYRIGYNKVKYCHFKKSDNVKFHYLNAIHDKMCMDLVMVFGWQDGSAERH